MLLGAAMNRYGFSVAFVLLAGAVACGASSGHAEVEVKTTVEPPKAETPAEVESCPAVVSAQPPAVVDVATLEKEAQAGVVGAAVSLADEYARQKNFAGAEKWYRFALYKGDGQGALGLYDLHRAGSIALDDAENIRQYGLNLIAEDAAKGNGGSAMTMAFLYLNGQFFPKDYDKAKDWFTVAEAANKPAASYQLGLLHSNGLYHDISPRRAFRYFEAAAAAGIAPATRQVAIAYHTGIGTTKNLDRAIVCYTRSAEQGDMLAMRDLGNIYRKDRPNAALSESWFKKAAALGDPDSHYALGMLYQGSSPSESKRHLDEAVKLKHHLARVKADPSYVPAPEEHTEPEVYKP